MVRYETTVAFAYYDLYEGFKHLRNAYKNIPAHVIVVDDGSPNRPLTREDVPPDWRLFRITEDIGWNNEGARNLMVDQCTTEWIVLHDMDCEIKEECFDVLENMNSYDLNPNKFYQLCERSRKKLSYRVISLSGRESQEFDHNNFAVNKNKFLEYGGYDETWNGYYGFDNNEFCFRRKMTKEIFPELEAWKNPESQCDNNIKKGRDWIHTDKQWPHTVRTIQKLRFPWIEIK